MGETIDKLKSDLQGHVKAAENRIQHLKVQLENAHQESSDAIHAKLDQAKADLEAEKKKVEERQARIKQAIQDDIAETKQDVHDWKHKRELHKLDRRAQRRENYAADSILIALAAIDEANVATLEALEARLDYEAVQTQA